MPEPFPTDPDEVRADWLADKIGVATVEQLSHAPVGTGQMARSSRFSFVTSDGSATVVCKFPSADPAVRELGARAYVKEVSFYRDIGQRAGALVPMCHHAAISATGEAFVLVLEDMAPADQGDQLGGCTVEEARRSLVNLAHLHGATWAGRNGIGELGWMVDDRDLPLSAYMAMAHGPFVERFRDRITGDALRVFARFTELADGWADSHPETTAAVHGDYRLDNLLFHPSNGSVAAVDWQTVSLANPGRDLAYFLGNSLTIDDRRRHEAELVDLYLTTLTAADVRYPREQCLEDYRHGAFQGPLVTMLGAFTAADTERGEDMFTVMADRCAAQILDHGALDLLT